MMFTSWRGLLLCGAVVWCYQMARRWRSDWEEFRSTTDGMARLAIAILWAVTAWAAYLVLGFALFLVRLVASL